MPPGELPRSSADRAMPGLRPQANHLTALSDDEKSSLDSEPGRSKRGKKPTNSSQTDAKVEDMSDDDDVSDAEPRTNGAGDDDEEEDDDELDLEEDE